jgi:WD40 repeat protein
MLYGERGIRIFDARDGNVLVTLTVPEGSLEEPRFSHDGTRVVAADRKSVRIWNSVTGEETALLPVLTDDNNDIDDLSFSPDDTRVVSASTDHTARIWKIFTRTDELINDSKQRAPRCLTQPQRTEIYLGVAPPAWCIEMNKWPYNVDAWKSWLAAKKAGADPPLPKD